MIGWITQSLEKKYESQPIPASLFARRDKGVGGIAFDLMLNESHGLTYKISEHPIDSGAVVTDHVQQQPRECSVTGIFSCHPIGSYSSDEIDIDEKEKITNNRALEKYLSIEKIAKEKKPIRLVTDLFDYPSMLIKSISVNRDKASGEMVTFQMSLIEYQSVTLSQVSSEGVIQPYDLTTDNRKKIASKVNSGRVSGTTVEEEKAAENTANLKKLRVRT